MSKIVLLGYMGCGKSTIAQRLAEITKIQYVDLDEYIEEKENTSIKNLFEKQGEVYFRKKEHLAFVDLLKNPTPMIIGLGGGTPCYANNHLLLKNNNVTAVYLKASIETLYKRLENNKSKRPIIAHKTPEELKEFIAKHLFDRSFYYNQAQYKVCVDEQTIEQTVQSIQKLATIKQQL